MSAKFLRLFKSSRPAKFQDSFHVSALDARRVKSWSINFRRQEETTLNDRAGCLQHRRFGQPIRLNALFASGGLRIRRHGYIRESPMHLPSIRGTQAPIRLACFPAAGLAQRRCGSRVCGDVVSSHVQCVVRETIRRRINARVKMRCRFRPVRSVFLLNNNACIASFWSRKLMA